jgi:hypothetical protein
VDNRLDAMSVPRKIGRERFRLGATRQPFNLLDFWQWSVSDLVSNATRGRLAEYIVARALGIDTTTSVRDEWAAYDLITLSGIRVEVKSAAYVQSWHQDYPSAIAFRTRPTLAWDAATNKRATRPGRHADVYVFALLAHQDKATIDPLDLSQWRFYVLSTATLDACSQSQHSITLKTLERLAGRAFDYSQLRDAVARLAPGAAGRKGR